MKFSEFYGVIPESNDDWFDPVLSVDTPLFIDPFLLYASETGHFTGSHDEVIAFFNSVFQLIARSGGNTSSILWERAVDLLYFPEVEELCLGYTDSGTRGSGSGRTLGRVMASALWEAVEAGLEEITHFEEVRILREGIGADRISDATAWIVRRRLALYTQEVCDRHGIPLEPLRYQRGFYNVDQERWVPLETQLPRNSYNGRGILLIPRRYLSALPMISPDDFWEYCYDNRNETLRNEYSQDITRHVDKRTIIDLAHRHPEFREQYLEYVEGCEPNPYDFDRDSQGLVQWYDATASYCHSYPLALLMTSTDEFVDAVNRMMEEFRTYVENNQGWRLLWNDNETPRREKAAQLLFLGIVKHYCRANNIDISRETNIGRGPVDFKVSQGYQFRALLELKLAKNTRFWNGLKTQLPAYQKAEDVNIGYFVVIVYSDTDFQRLTDIQDRVAAVNAATGYRVNCIIVDARRSPPSASTL